MKVREGFPTGNSPIAGDRREAYTGPMKTQLAMTEPGISVHGNRGVKIVRSCLVRKPAEELYTFWRDLENLPQVIKYPVKITTLSSLESHWEVSGPFSSDPIGWDAMIINDEPGRLIAWRSRDGAEIANAGSVRFDPAPGEGGTMVTVKLEYDPPGGKFGQFLGKLTGREPGEQVAETLRRFKQLMEFGRISEDAAALAGPEV